MWKLIGLLLVVAVSDGEEVPVEEMTFDGIVNHSVLLQCPCNYRMETKDFRWQKEVPNSIKVYSSKMSDFDEKYKGRARIFVAQDKFNCSLLLTNITAEDQGRYRCSYFINEEYRRSFLNLNVYANYSVCQINSDTNPKLSGKVFQCDVKGHYRDTEIHWYLDSQRLTNSSTTSITNTHALEASTGIYNFRSELVMELRGTSKPTCNVSAKGVSATSSCVLKPQMVINLQSKCFKTYLNVVPIVLALGFSLILWCRWKRTQGLPRTTVENDYSNC